MLYPLRSTTTGEDVKAVKATLADMNLQLDSRLLNATISGTGSMVGNKA